jgi:hypothetical protein
MSKHILHLIIRKVISLNTKRFGLYSFSYASKFLFRPPDKLCLQLTNVSNHNMIASEAKMTDTKAYFTTESPFSDLRKGFNYIAQKKSSQLECRKKKIAVEKNAILGCIRNKRQY